IWIEAIFISINQLYFSGLVPIFKVDFIHSKINCMSLIFSLFIIVSMAPSMLMGQGSKEQDKPSKSKDSSQKLPNIVFDPDKTVETQHTVTVKGQKIPYKATTGTLPVWDDEGKCIAGLFFTYYERSDIKDRTSRPLV